MVVKFVQIMEFQTSRTDEMDAVEEEWRKATEGKRTLSRELKAQDRDRPGTYVVIAEFPSYEAAMKNNDLPETQKIAEQMAKLAEGGITFRNLDVIDEH
jgi:quinol monooxygenase YgiN